MTPYAITALVLAVAIVMFGIGLFLGNAMAQESTRRMRSRIRTLPEATTPIGAEDESMWSDPNPQPVDAEWLDRMRNAREVAPIYEADDDDDEWEWWQDDHPHESTPSYAAEQLAWYEEQAESEQATHRLTRTLERLRRDLEAETSPQPTPTMDDDTFERIVTAIDAADPQNIWPE